jgi:RNA polymerase sigma-70 factor, ECF subfamily
MTDVAPDPSFERERDRLWGLAYRVCGRRTDADDVMQEAWVRWQRQDASTIERPAAWLTTVVSRLAIDHLRDRQRVGYVGPWLPEPLAAPVDDHADLVDSLTVGFLTMLERLEPIERVVFLLADVFDEPFAAIADTVGKSEAACRQIASRARHRVRDDRRRGAVSAASQRRIANAFAMAAYQGDLDAIVGLLHDDAVLISDGGAQHHAARRPVVGPERIARFVANVIKRIPSSAQFVPMLVNGEPAIVTVMNGRHAHAMVVHATGEPARVEAVFMIVNPDKLAVLSG